MDLKKLTPHPLTNFEIQSYYQNEPRFSGVYSRDNLPDKMKDGTYVVNLDEYSDIGTHWIALYVNNKTVTCFDSFGLEHISKEVKKLVNNKNIIANIFRKKAYVSVMCGYFCIGFIDYMFMGKSLTDYTNLFSPNYFKINDGGGGVSIASFTTVIGAPIGITSAILILDLHCVLGLQKSY